MKGMPHIQSASVTRAIVLACSLLLLAGCGADQVLPSNRPTPSPPWTGAPAISTEASAATLVPTPVPSADLVGSIRGAPELEGGICPVLLTDDAGERWEVYLGSGYTREYRGDEMLIIGPDGEIIARSGDRVGFNISVDESLGSFCMAGIPVTATDIVFVQPQDD